MEKVFAVGIDVGGTTSKFGIVSSEGKILAQDRIPTNKHEDVSEFIDELYNMLMPMIEEAGGSAACRGIGMGAPNGNIYTCLLYTSRCV